MTGKFQTILGSATEPTGSGVKIICHVCNDVGAWGKGFVLAISQKWKLPEAAYRHWFYGVTRPDLALPVPFDLGQVLLCRVEHNIWVANMLAQSGLRSPQNPIPLSYDALEKCFERVGQHSLSLNASVHMPRVGCGLGGGDWETVESIVRKTLTDIGIDVSVYDI